MSWDQYTKQAEVGGGGEFPEVSDDLYDAIIQDVTEPRTGPDPFNLGKEKIDFIVKWELTSGDVAEGTTLWQYVTLPEAYLSDGYLNEKSNLYKLMEALGFDLGGRFKVDPPSWQGLTARVMVENKPDKQGELRPRITGVKAARTKKAPAREPVAAGARPAARKRPTDDAEAWDEE